MIPKPINTGQWSKKSWRSFPILQQPEWPDTEGKERVFKTLATLPALVFAGETRDLENKLSGAVQGEQFVLQCGDCAEKFSDCNGPRIHALLKLVLQMAIVLTYVGEKKIITIGRICGQYAKPRSSLTEDVNGLVLPSYRGDMVNCHQPTLKDRKPDPERVMKGYFRAAATLNLLRAFTQGGYASLEQVRAWHEDFCDRFPMNPDYEKMSQDIHKAIKFMSAMGVDTEAPELNKRMLFTSHEALLLEYEEALTRIDTATGVCYDTSAHMLWLGDRTRQPYGAHVEFLRGVGNPLGMKIGPEHDHDDLKSIITKLNPKNQPGRLTLITRFGNGNIETFLPPLLREMKKEGFNLVWCCDPMHGNTYKTRSSIKTRKFADIIGELKHFFDIHKAEGTIAGGVHLELTSDDVTECVGGSQRLQYEDLERVYETHCDPRLNAAQAVELAHEISQMIK